MDQRDGPEPGLAPLVPDPGRIRLAVLGATEGNGHPFSWSAIINGYDDEVMAKECPFPGIPAYLGLEPQQSLGIPGVSVTHVHCTPDGGFTAESVAGAALIPHVVDNPEDVIGKVDAVVIATDRGSDHVRQARPFVEAGLPLFIDKPLATDAADLAVFKRWVGEGKPIMSSSSMRYAKEFLPYQHSTHELGDLRFVTVTSPKSWEAYGIHALEAVYPIVGPGFESVQNTGGVDRNVVHLRHSSGIDVVACVSADMYGAFGLLQLCGTKGAVQLSSRDTFYSFKAQLLSFIDYLRTGQRPYPFAETEEVVTLVIAALLSRAEGGRRVEVDEIKC